ncbi:MAG: hypothetical protein RL318_2449 [Fibrobacterota bacterium]
MGALPTCGVRLPRPAPDVLAQVNGAQSAPQEFQWNDAVILIEDVTCTADSLLRQAKIRIAAEPERERWSASQSPVAAILCLLFLLTAFLSPFFADFRPQALQVWQAAHDKMESEKLAMQSASIPVLQAPRPHASLPGADQERIPLIFTMGIGQNLSKLLRADGGTSGTGNGGKIATAHDCTLVEHGLFLAVSAEPYTSPSAALYRSPDLSGLFQPG